MTENIKIVLKSGKDQSLRRYHPWVFSGAIAKFVGKPVEGCVVDVYDNKDEFLATGHYQNNSIAVRVLSFKKRPIDQEFWIETFRSAVEYRKSLGLFDGDTTNAFRLFHGEGDGVPGLIIDFYNGVAVMQAHSIGVHKQRNMIVDALREVLGSLLVAVYDKSSGTLPHIEGVDPEEKYIYGSASSLVVSEYECKFKVDWEFGQKTGFFLDQRENRKLVEYYSKNKNVLNMFCYTGGFSVYALKGGANLVHSVDSSAKAIELTDENIALNFPDTTKHKSFAVDAFSYLDGVKDAYDLIILDPPAFAKHVRVLDNALKGYKRLNMRAFEQIKKGGILFTFSCSQVVSKEDFRKSVFAAAANTGRKVRILHQLTQPPCHPVSIYHPEGEYLKGLVLQVE